MQLAAVVADERFGLKVLLQHEGRVWLPSGVGLRREKCRSSVVLAGDRGDLVAIGDEFGDVHITPDPTCGEWNHIAIDNGPIEAVSLSRSGHMLAETRQKASVWEGVADEAEYVKDIGIKEAALSPCGKMVAYNQPGALSYWIEIKAIGKNRVVERIKKNGLYPAKPIAWSPLGNLVAIGWHGCQAGVWKLGSSEPIWQTRLAEVGPRVQLEIRRLEFSYNGQLLACLIGGWDRPKLFIVSVGGEVLREFDAPAFSSDVVFWNDASAVTVLGENQGATYTIR